MLSASTRSECELVGTENEFHRMNFSVEMVLVVQEGSASTWHPRGSYTIDMYIISGRENSVNDLGVCTLHSFCAYNTSIKTLKKVEVYAGTRPKE